MIQSTYNGFRHRRTGAVAAYKRAVLSLMGILTVAWVLRNELWARFVRPPGNIYVATHPFPGYAKVGTFGTPISDRTYQAQERFISEMMEFWMWPHEYLIARAQFEPILAFLVLGAVVTLVARFGPPIGAWLNDMRRV